MRLIEIAVTFLSKHRRIEIRGYVILVKRLQLSAISSTLQWNHCIVDGPTMVSSPNTLLLLRLTSHHACGNIHDMSWKFCVVQVKLLAGLQRIVPLPQISRILFREKHVSSS